jgi:hypothetical protein
MASTDVLKKAIIAVSVGGLFLSLGGTLYGRSEVRDLVADLLAIGYPVSKADVVALDKIAMRFDARNRLDVLKKILSDREAIHNIKQADYLAKTEAVCSALSLLDEHNLPEVDAYIKALSHQGGWEQREKERLSYMAAKRDIDYASNVVYLLGALTQYTRSPEAGEAVDISVRILDLTNCLSYLADIFSHTGDIRILNALLKFAAHAYGYPGEYISRLFGDMLIQQPNVFVRHLAALDRQTRNHIINWMVFGIWNNQQKANVLASIRDDLVPETESERQTVALLIRKINDRFPPVPAGAGGAAGDGNGEK